MATLWGIPASLLVNTIWKGVSAGTSRVSVSKAIPDAVIVTCTVAPPLPPSDGAAVGAPEGAGVAGADDAGAGEAAPPPPEASPRGGMTPPAISSDPTKSTAKTMSVPVGKRGAGMFSRWPVASAFSTSRYSFRASTSQPTRPMTVMRRPAMNTTGSMTRPSSMAAVAIEASRGRNEGPGMWTPAGGPTTTGAPALVADPSPIEAAHSRPQAGPPPRPRPRPPARRTRGSPHVPSRAAPRRWRPGRPRGRGPRRAR